MNTPKYSNSLGDAALYGGEVPEFKLPEEVDDGTTSGADHQSAEVDTDIRGVRVDESDLQATGGQVNATPKITQAPPVAPAGNPESAGDVGAVCGSGVVELEAGAVNCSPVRKTRKKRQLKVLPTSAQNELRPLMPELPTGFWWECPADDKGFRVKLRWRGGQAPHSHVFPRVGKIEFQTWSELNEEDRSFTIADRLRVSLLTSGHIELARRIGLTSGND